MPRPSRLVATLTLFSHLSLLPLLGGGCLTWRPVTHDALLDVASQPDVDHRILAGPEKITIDGDTPVRIHTADGIREPVPSRYLHSYGVHLEVQPPSEPPIRVDSLGADFQVPDNKATLGLVLGLAIPLVILVPLIIVASAYRNSMNWGPLCPPSNPSCVGGL